METVKPSEGLKHFHAVASLLGSGINGNYHLDMQVLKHLKVASLLGSGINENVET